MNSKWVVLLFLVDCLLSSASVSTFTNQQFVGFVLGSAIEPQFRPQQLHFGDSTYKSCDSGCGWRKSFLQMKSTREEKKKKKDNAEDGAAAQSSMSKASAPVPPAPRVDPNLNVSMRRQIAWAKMNKEFRNANSNPGWRPKVKAKQSYRKVKGEEPEYVEKPDLSKVKVSMVRAALMVDGYNLIHAWSKLKKRMVGGRPHEAREMLLSELGEMAAVRGWDVTVVFDAMNREGAVTSTSRSHGCDVVYTAAGVEADHYIERRTMELKEKGCPSIMVATGDTMIQSVAGGNGALILSPNKLIQEMKAAKSEMQATCELINAKADAMRSQTLGDALGPEMTKYLYQLISTPDAEDAEEGSNVGTLSPPTSSAEKAVGESSSPSSLPRPAKGSVAAAKARAQQGETKPP